MKKETLFLKLAVLLIATPVVLLCTLWLPKFPDFYAQWLPQLAYLRYPIVLFFYATSIPFFFALYQTLKLLTYIDKNKAFSQLSLHSLKKIKYSAVTISALYMLGSPFFFVTADLDDAPGIVGIGLVIAVASFVIAVFAAILQKLLQTSIELKTENELTI